MQPNERDPVVSLLVSGNFLLCGQNKTRQVNPQTCLCTLDPLPLKNSPHTPPLSLLAQTFIMSDPSSPTSDVVLYFIAM